MTYYGGKELADSLRTVRKNTIQIAEDIPEAQYSFKATPESRSVAQILAHIALGYRFQQQVHAIERRTSLAGFDFPAMVERRMKEESTPRDKSQLIELLRTEGSAWASWVEGVAEEFLAERVSYPSDPPSSKSRFEMLLSTKEHEMHHRGQLMLLERILGIVPHLTRERQARMQGART
jgi:uncharacterized damage-inducible protein DinB